VKRTLSQEDEGGARRHHDDAGAPVAHFAGLPYAGMTRIRFDGCFSAALAAPLAIR